VPRLEARSVDRTLRNRWFADSSREGTGFEPSVQLLRKALLGVANWRRRYERRSHLQVQVRGGDACLEWFPIAFLFVVGPRVRILLPPPTSLSQQGPADTVG
jgi:hypothetical protein